MIFLYLIICLYSIKHAMKLSKHVKKPKYNDIFTPEIYFSFNVKNTFAI